MEVSNPPFGLIVAYLLPGFIGLGGIVLLVPAVKQWLQPVAYQGAAGIAPPIYAILAALAFGMILSCFRWIIIDHVHHWTGVRAPKWNFKGWEDRLVAFNYIVERNYRYYQFYANTLIAVIWTYSLIRWTDAFPLLSLGTDLGAFLLCAALFAGSRDTLVKYYERSSQLVGVVAEKDDTGEIMTNGFHQDGGSNKTAAASTSKPEVKKEPLTREAPKEPQKDQSNRAK